MRNERGFSMIQALISGSIMAVVALAGVSYHKNQLKAQNFIEFNGKNESIRSAIISQFLSETDNCKCFFIGASEFPASGTTALAATAPTAIGRFNFPTPGSCAGTTVPNPIVSNTGVDGIQSTSFELRNITAVSGQYNGEFIVNLRTTKDVLGPKEQQLKFPVTITTAPGAGSNVSFQGCSSSEITFTAPDPNARHAIAFTTQCRGGTNCDAQATSLCQAHTGSSTFCVKDIYATIADGGDKNIGVEGYTCRPELCANGTTSDFTVASQAESY